MAEVTERNALATRRRILKEYKKVKAQIATNPSVWRSVTFRAHKRICEAMGKDYVDYPEFEFWFSIFARGDFDLHHDRSSDPKTRSLIDFPLEVFNKIGEFLNLEDRMRLRDVCKDIRYHVDNWDPKVTAFCYFNASHWNLHHNSKPYFLRSFDLFNPISFIMNLLKHPKLQLEKLSIYEDVHWKKLIKRLDESNQKLHVKHVEFPYRRSSEIDLHYMIPGVLEEISVFMENPSFEVINDFIISEQCQAAKMVYIDSWTANSRFPLEALYNCPRFTLQLKRTHADDLKARFLKRLMKLGKVQTCVLYISNCFGAPSPIMKYFNEPEAMVPDFPSLRRYPIPETNDFYELEYRVDFVRLERKQ